MLDSYLDQIKAHADAERAAGMAAHHKMSRVYIGVSNPILNDLTKTWRQELDVASRVKLSGLLWKTDIYEARLAATKLLLQARMRPDDAAWDMIQSWLPDFDHSEIADHACLAGQKRLIADTTRLDDVESWITSDHMWTRRAALVITLPWTKQNFPKPNELECRDRVLGWIATLAPDHNSFIQKVIAGWLSELSKHDAPRVTAFLDEYGDALKPYTRKEIAHHMNKAKV